jgi:sarcosine oxidase gamma subunit
MSNEIGTCLIDRRPARLTLEFAAYRPVLRDHGDALWPQAPGAARFDAEQRPLLLHFAPGRWLAPDASPETRALLVQAQEAGTGVLLDVTGKWDALVIRGPGAARLLACDIAIGSVLQDRDCAAITLFDCPAAVARVAEGFALWVQSSYTADFMACAERFRAALESRA